MSNIYTIHPPKSDLVLFYEVIEPDGANTWGGASAEHCIEWLSLAPSGSRVLVSAWDSDEAVSYTHLTLPTNREV